MTPRTWMSTATAAALALAVASGCAEAPRPEPGPSTASTARAATAPSSPAAATCTARPRRLSVAQVEKSIATLFGGITWRPSPTSKTNYFKTYAATLGKADYITITEESYEPSMLFMKYMDDMAGYVCHQAVARDAVEPDWASRLVVPFPDPERHHALVSSGRKVVRGMIEGGTPLPAGRPGPAAFREVVAAVCAATRRLPAELLRPGPARDLLVHVASRRTELSRARVAAWLRRDPAVVSRVLARPVPGAAIRSVERLLGDPRFPLLRATEDLARRPGWAEYRSRALSLDPPGQPGRHLLRQVLGRGA